MTQISSNTLIYEQIFSSLKSFFLEDMNGDFQDEQEKIAKYNEIITKIYSNIGMPLTEYTPFIHGEPPFSQKINRFSSSFSSDINQISKQVDYLNAKVVNSFNLFLAEIEKEKSFVNRIFSKSKILQMYSKSPAEDIVYFGDSFDNMDNIDISSIKSSLIPMIKNGSLTFSPKEINRWPVSKISLLPSNGFIGNNHEVFRSSDEESDSGYKYRFIETPFVTAISSIVDDSPLSYFEYEALSVQKPESYYEDEFKYIADGNVATTVGIGDLYDWSSHPESDPLVLQFKIETNYPQYANSIDIFPNFGSSNIIKVNSIIAYDSQGNSENILSQPIYIGSSIAPLNAAMVNEYFYNSATIKFSERMVKHFIIEISQENYRDIEIQHAYWRPIQTDVVTPFDGMDRFNPSLLNQAEYINVSFDKSRIIPSMGLVNNIKVQPGRTTDLLTLITQSDQTISGYAIKMTITDQNNSETDVYYSGLREYNNSQVIDYINIDDLRSDNAATVVYSSIEDASSAISSGGALLSWIEDVNNSINGFNPYEMIDRSGERFFLDKESLEVVEVSYFRQGREVEYNVTLQLEKEILNAKRWSIGIADVSVSHEIYNDEFEMISNIYIFDKSIESVMLSVDSTDTNLYSNELSFRYYMSTGANSWFEISPIELSSRGIAEVVAFNKKILESNKLAGVAYLNYPDVPEEVRTIRVKIVCSKSPNRNITPLIHSYQIIAKVKSQ